MKKLSTKNYYIAYLDFLGMKKRIANDKNDEHLNNLQNIYDSVIEDKRYAIKILEKKIFIKIFSDNIVIAVRCSSNISEDKEIIEQIINLCGLIQVHSLKYSYLIRGAIIKGKFCKTDKFIYGKALVDVVNIEEKIAIYPRIIIDGSLFDVIDFNSQYTKKDSDSFLYVNIFHYFLDNCYESFKNNILNQLQRGKDDYKIRQKIIWFINRYNEHFIEKHKKGKAQNTKIINEEEILRALK